MEYRTFGKLGWKVSALGFGAMRLPTPGGSTGNDIDEGEAVRMVRHAIDEGVNYLDTAWIYHGGKSEELLGKALAGGYRDKVRLATKSQVWMVQCADDFDRFLDEQLLRLQTDHIDCYLLHGLNEKTWQNIVLRHRLLERAEAAVRDGRIRHIGFSFHDGYSTFEKIVNAYDWSFCQIQYNYMDVENQAGVRGLKLAAARGLAVVVMEPLLGGRLANPPAPMREVFEQSGTRFSPAELALRWLWDQPEVSTVLSGMSTMEQVKANIASACASGVHSFGSEDFAAVDLVRTRYRERTVIPCTRCGYCMPCPNGVDIPRNFEIYNEASMHEDFPSARFVYKTFTPEPERASGCVACRVCEELCPQKIDISQWMPKVADALGEQAPA
jgi:predicted aldo/keto reductase-like oxidoreductase